MRYIEHYKNYQTLRNDLDKGVLALRDLVGEYLLEIQKRQSLNAFLAVFADEALQKADDIQHKIQQGTAGKLAGMVIAIKDNICYQGHVASASSKMLEKFEPLYTATVLERLLAEDAIVIGRLNCDEFAMGGSNEYSAFGVVKNPLDESKVPGGSSGGSSAAVAANLCFASLGSDTGGSVRQPAAFCGITGYKPTYGLFSRWGLIAYASSFDQIGLVTKSVQDATLLTSIMAGLDQHDASMSQIAHAVNPSMEKGSLQGKRIAYIKEYVENPALDSHIKKQFQETLNRLVQEGATVESVDFAYLDYMVPTYYILTTAEASSNLSRYTGVHYGHRSENAKTLEEVYVNSRTEGFGDEVKRRIMLGTFVLSHDNYESFFIQAQQVRRLITEDTLKIFKNYDFIATPTTPGTAFGLGEKKNQDPTVLYLEDIFTVHANLSGLPAIAIPMGKHDNGLPTSFQLMAKPFDDEKLLHVAQTVQTQIFGTSL